MCGITAEPPWHTFWSRIGSASKAQVRGARFAELKDLVWGFAAAGSSSHRLLSVVSDEVPGASSMRFHEPSMLFHALP